MADTEKNKYKVKYVPLVDKNIASSYNIPLGIGANFSLDLDDVGYENYNYRFVNYDSSSIWGNIKAEIPEYKYLQNSVVFATRESAPYPQQNEMSFSWSQLDWWLPPFAANIKITGNVYFRWNWLGKNIQAGDINADGSEASPFATYNTHGLFLLLQAGGGNVSRQEDYNNRYYGGGGGGACIVYINLYKANPIWTSVAEFRVNKLDTGEIDLDFKTSTSSYSTQVRVLPGNGRQGGSVQIISNKYCQVLKTFQGGNGTAVNIHGGNITSNPDSDHYALPYFYKQFYTCRDHIEEGTRYITGVGSSGGATYYDYTYGGAGGSLLSFIDTNYDFSICGWKFLGGFGYGAVSADIGPGSSVGYILTTYDN